jgi:hypothetical protein
MAITKPNQYRKPGKKKKPFELLEERRKCYWRKFNKSPSFQHSAAMQALNTF